MRRGIRHGYKLGAKEPFLYSLVESLVKEMESAFPMLASNQKQIEEIIHNEEKKFLETLDKGIEILEKEISNIDSKVIPGDVVFKLHDTFGFPFDLTADIAREQDLKLDEAGFNKCMEEQVKNSKSASKFKGTQLDLSSIDETKFLGYDRLNAEGKILGLWNDDLQADSATADKEYFLALDQTPFYAESGGQVGDQGKFSCSSGSGQILDCIKQGKIFLHTIKIDEGAVKLGDKLKLAVEPDKRASAASNHSATHLMHAALKHVLGSHVEQKGSLVDASKLRFDFSHPKAVTKDEIKQIELLVNQHTLNNAEVKTELMKLDDAIASGAEAMFGEKYDDEVRVLSMSDGFSVELCGGTHVTRTGDIGMFVILSESSVSSGVRRIEAVTGAKAVELALEIRSQLQAVQGILNVGAAQVGSKVEDLVKENKSLKKGSKTNGRSKVDLKEIIHKINNFDLVLIEADTQNIQDLRQLVDSSKKDQSQRCVLILSHQDSKVVMVCGLTDDIQESLSANDVIQAIAKASDGKGGGRKDFAQGVGEADNFKEFVKSIPDIVQSIA
jgi:alanyl-tRNA synthetase